MNSHTEDNTPLQTWTDPELEARVVALILGEASDFEREEIERHLAEQPELRLFQERIEEVHGLLGGRGEQQTDWRLSEERRAKVLAAIAPPVKPKRPSVWAHPAFRIAAAVVILGAVLSSLLIPAGQPVLRNPRETSEALVASASLDRSDLSDLTHQSDRFGFSGMAAPASPPPPLSAAPAPAKPAARVRTLAEADEPPTLAQKSLPGLSQAGGEGFGIALQGLVGDKLAMNAPAEPEPVDSFSGGGGRKALGTVTASGGSAVAGQSSGDIRLSGSTMENGRVRPAPPLKMLDGPAEPAPTVAPKIPGAALRGERLLAEKDDDGAARELKRSLDLLPDAPVVESRREEYAKKLAGGEVQRSRELADAPSSASDPFSADAIVEESQVRANHMATLAAADERAAQADSMEYVVNRLHSTIIPELEFEDTPLEDALAFLEQKSFEVDDLEPDPSRKGLKIVAAPGLRESLGETAPTINLKLTRVSFADALRYITELAMVSYKVEGDKVVIEPVPVESITPPPPPVTLEIDSATEPFSTFSLHVSDVSFQLAQAALAKNEWPEKESVRIEEFVNAFDYGDPSPDEAEPVACQVEQAAHPFLQQRNLLRFGVRTASTGRGASSPLRLTLLLDRSGSMERPDRQETVQRALEQLAAEMRDGDELTVIAFARQPRLVVDRANREGAAKLPADLAAIPTEGGTNLEAALSLAAQKARATKTPGAQNRIVLLTDGAANLGDANPDRLAERIHALRQEGIAFDAAGIGADGLNDTILEALTRKGDGRYYLLNGPEDAGEGFARKLAGAFRPGAKDVKVQIQFNPDRVGRYRLLGFEEHRLKKEEFRDDTVDAAELASEEAGVAVYQVEVKPDGSGDVGFVSVRFLDVASGERVERRWLIPFEPKTPGFDQAPPSLQLAGLAAWTAAKLKDDPAAASTDWPALNRIHAGLPEAWKSAPRVRGLGEMITVAGASSPRE